MTITLVRIEVQSKLVWQCLQAASGQWVAVCDTLKLTIQSDTFSELMEDIHQTLDAMFKDLLATGELDKFFQDHGWKALNAIPQDPAEVRFDMPFFTAMMGTRDAQEHVRQ